MSAGQLVRDATRSDDWTRAPAVLGHVPLGSRRFVAGLLVMGCAATGTLSTVSVEDALALRAVYSEPSTLPAAPSLSKEPYDQVVANTLQRLRTASALSWGEIAYAVGVSRRSVHNWLTGSRVARVHLGRLNDLIRTVDRFLGMSADDVRASLLRGKDDGRSLLDDLALVAQPVRRVPLSTISVGDQLGPVSDEAGRPEVPPRRSALRGEALPRRADR